MALTKVGKEGITGVDNSADATAITINSSEQVGIGTTSPSYKLTINSADEDHLKFENGSELAFIRLTDAGILDLWSHGTDEITFSNGTGSGTERMRIDSSGRLLRGSTTDLTGICQSFFKNIHQGEGGIGIGNNDGANTTNAMIFRNSNGNIGSIQTSSSSTIFNTSSDYRLKENVDYTFDATTRLKQLKPARFNFIADADTTVDGFLAHEVSSIVPEAISGEKDDTKDRTNVVLSSTNVVIGFNVTEEEWTKGKTDGIYASNTTWSSTHTEIVAQQIDQSKLVPLLVKTIQELEARITALESA